MQILASDNLLHENKNIQWKMWKYNKCWTWESKVMRGLGSIPTGGNSFHWIFFWFLCSKASAANIGIIVIIYCAFRKSSNETKSNISLPVDQKYTKIQTQIE